MVVIGRKDKVDLPELGLFNIEAKIDSGAYRSALHCHQIKIIQKEGKNWLSFKVLDPSHPEYSDKVFFFKDYGETLVKNSGGKQEHRYTFKTKLVIFNKPKTVEFSLTDRKKMKYPVLLGRRFLSNKYLVDVKKADISFQQKTHST